MSGVSQAAGLRSGQSNRERNSKKENIEGMNSVYFKKRLSKAKPSFEILRFDIRYSAVRCLIQAIEAASLIIKKTCHLA